MKYNQLPYNAKYSTYDIKFECRKCGSILSINTFKGAKKEKQREVHK